MTHETRETVEHGRGGAAAGEAAAPPRPAAVLVPVYRAGGGDLRLVLVRRREGGIHGGQIAFPGGKREPADATLLATALREAQEEIGLPADLVRVLAELPVIETTTSRFTIAPFLGRIEPPPGWTRQEEEIAEIMDVSVDELAAPEARGTAMMSFPLWPEPRSTPFLRVGGHRLWGATFRILVPLLPRLLDGEWPV